MKKHKHLYYKYRYYYKHKYSKASQENINIVEEKKNNGKGKESSKGSGKIGSCTGIDIKKNIEMALEIWKIEKKVNKLKKSLGEDVVIGFDFPIKKIYEILEEYNIKIIDYTGKKYIEGMNGIEIISVEKDKNQKEPIVLDTINPLIEVHGDIYLRSKVIILSS